MHGYVRARWALLLVMAAGLGGPGCGDGGAAQDDAASGALGASNSAVGPGSGGSDAGGSGGDGVGGASAGGAAGQGGAGGSGASGGGANAGGAGTGGAGPVVCSDQSSPYATGVLAHQFGPGQDYGQDAFPYNVFGPPHGGGQNAGSLDVVSLGEGGSVVLSFTDNAIVDGPGPDFLVFENAFGFGPNPEDVFAEVGTVAVSDDGVTWVDFPCAADEPPWGQCAGWHPVFANPDDNAIDPTDPATAGGDVFDLADVGLEQARYVRITDRPDLADVFDLDAVAIAHGLCP